MNTRTQFAFVLAAVLAAAPAARAVVTATAPLRSSQSSVLGCAALNLSDQPVQVAAELDSGGLAGVLESGTLEIPAGQNRQVVFSSAAIFGGYCVFEFDGDPSAVRGSINLQDLGGSNTRQVFTAEPIELQRLTEITTYSAPVRSSEGDNLLCVAHNLGNEPVQVTAELDNGLGTLIDDGTLTLEARQTRVIASSNTAIFGGYCRFSFSGNATEVRGYIELQDAGGSNTRLSKPAVPIAAAAPVESPTPTETATEVPTCAVVATPCAGGACCGDCNGNGTVQINELITAVGFALGSCPAQ